MLFVGVYEQHRFTQPHAMEFSGNPRRTHGSRRFRRKKKSTYSLHRNTRINNIVILLLILLLLSRSCVTDSINENSWTQQRLNGTTPLSAAERFRRLVPYVTYYIVGGGNDDDNGVLQQQQQQQYRHQNYENPFTSSTASPVAANNNNFYVEQNERKPSQQSAAQYHHQYHQHQQYDYQTSNQLHEQHASTTTPPPPEYLRFPSSPKFRRPIVIATTPQPAPHSNYDYYDYDGHTSPRRPIVRPVQHVEYFLPTVPPPPPPPPPQQQQPFTSAKGKKTRRPAAAKPKRPSTSPSIATTDKYGALNELLNGYDLGNRLSNKITAENIGSNIQTLSDVLEILQKEAGYQETRTKKPAATRRPEYRPDPIDEYDTGDVGNPGRPGIDYPTLSVIPKTSFDCKTQRYKGFFGDPETQCQVNEKKKNHCFIDNRL